MFSYSDYPRPVVEDIARLRRRITASGLPKKSTDRNLIIGTWNIRGFGSFFEGWGENPGSPKRNLRSMALIAEIIRGMDVIAIQEVKRETNGIRFLIDRFLGPNWGLILSDVSAGSGGNTERLAYLYDVRRVKPSGLAGEVVLPPSSVGDPQKQFDRTPYIVGFESGGEKFSLLTAHIKYGDVPEDRLPELRAIADFSAREIVSRSVSPKSEERNLILLGDFNIDQRGDNPLFQAFVSTGLFVPDQLLDMKTTFGSKPKFYDQIAWFRGQNFNLKFGERAGLVDFANAIYQEMSPFLMSFRMSDHFPLWVEFQLDRSVEEMGATLGLDEIQLAMPDPLSVVPD